ncbi:hypothetical protein J437_LFUL004090 [Ladona fulva]|uniref:Cadherin domain-containing protein n=1 Tax=Ladona fulva TaxID=123851 RepID=A0A8K0P0P0_LADFU|nr:hypothetical protein J437_LFUL004090 [Ladona fulva]
MCDLEYNEDKLTTFTKIREVTDTNDNAPVFSESAYSFDVAEDATRGSRVGAVEATDEDEGANGQVTYTVVSDWANDVFSLNPQSGVFTLTSRLDYEEVREHSISRLSGAKNTFCQLHVGKHEFPSALAGNFVCRDYDTLLRNRTSP